MLTVVSMHDCYKVSSLTANSVIPNGNKSPLLRRSNILFLCGSYIFILLVFCTCSWKLGFNKRPNVFSVILVQDQVI